MYKYASGRAKKELEGHKAELRSFYIDGDVQRDDMFFADYARAWYATKKEPFISESSRTSYEVSLGIVVAVMLALLLNQQVRGIRAFRTVFYLPSVISAVALSLLWMWMFEPSYGLINTFLSWFGIQGPKWLKDPTWVKPALVIMSVWTTGGSMLIYLAALQDVPKSLYEAATIDGTGVFARFLRVALPMITPTIFFNLITGFIGGMQVFSQAFIMTSGGPAYASYFYAYALYDKAFVSYQMGYASAMAWFLLIITLALSMIILGTSNKWVYYEGDR